MLFLIGLTTILSTVSALISRDSGNKDLRILPLGASITYGLQSSNGNGYREDLRKLLSPIPVTYVGSQCSGSMIDGNNEGHPGFVIPQMQSVATPDLVDKPNVVLVYVGTNDMKFGNAAQAPDNMKKLVSFLVDKLPDALIVVSKLFLNSDPAVQKRIEAFNQKVSEVQKLGNVLIADMSSALSASDLSSDGTHPNDGGYAKMAKVFYTVLMKAEQQGKISNVERISEKLHICNVPEAEKQGPNSTPRSSVTSSTTKTTKPVKTQSTVPSSIQTHTSDEAKVHSQSSLKSTTTQVSKSSATSVSSKPKSTTCNLGKTGTPSAKQDGKLIAQTVAISSSQSLLTTETNPTSLISPAQSSASVLGASATSDSALSLSQLNTGSLELTSNPATSSAVTSLDSDTVGTTYPTSTTSSGSSPASDSTAPVSATSSLLPSDGNSGLQISSNSSAIAYSSNSIVPSSSSITLSSKGSSTMKASLYLTVLSLSFLIML